MFGSIAQGYDRANAILSCQMHRHWNKALVKAVGNRSATLLDLCSGTGEITFTTLKNRPYPCHAFLLDFCPEMLECSRQKATKISPIHTLTYLQADAQAIPLPDQSIACATMAYGIRNVKDPRKAIEEVYRVLQPGGTFGILELTEPENSFLRTMHGVYLRKVLPLLGRYATSNQAAYEYLCNSIKAFIRPSELAELLKAAGFHNVSQKPLLGGIATILIAKKRV